MEREHFAASSNGRPGRIPPLVSASTRGHHERATDTPKHQRTTKRRSDLTTHPLRALLGRRGGSPSASEDVRPDRTGDGIRAAIRTFSNPEYPPHTTTSLFKHPIPQIPRLSPTQAFRRRASGDATSLWHGLRKPCCWFDDAAQPPQDALRSDASTASGTSTGTNQSAG